MKNKITITITNDCHITGLSKKVKEIIKEALTFVNPKWKQAEDHGTFKSIHLKPWIKYFKSSKKDLIVPKGTYPFVVKMIKKYSKQEFELIDNTIAPKIKKIKFKGKLRPLQQTAFKRMMHDNMGVLEAATGSGKTVMGLRIISQRQTKTLILVHNKELLYQWQERIKTFLDYDCGLLGDSNYEIKDITVGIINTVRNRTKELKDQFGMVVVDECHRCPSTTWTDCLAKFTARYHLGLSATPYRKDGLGNAIYAFVGPPQHVISTKKLQDIGSVLKPTIKRINTQFNFYYRNNYTTMIKDLCNNVERNKLIASEVIKDYKKRKKAILIVSDRVEHCKTIQKLLEDKDLKTVLLHAGVPKNKRKDIVKKVKDGEADILISTLSLIGEGFDAPDLYSLFLITPVKFSGRLLQIVGRILRPKKGKKAIVFDFRDDKCGVLRGSGRTRDEVYTNENW